MHFPADRRKIPFYQCVDSLYGPRPHIRMLIATISFLTSKKEILSLPGYEILVKPNNVHYRDQRKCPGVSTVGEKDQMHCKQVAGFVCFGKNNGYMNILGENWAVVGFSRTSKSWRGWPRKRFISHLNNCFYDLLRILLNITAKRGH